MDVVLSALDFVVKCALVIIGALVAVHYAFKRFKSEALWSRKLDAYSKILEALHYSGTEADERYELALKESAGESPPKYTKSYQEYLDEREKVAFKAKDEMKKILGTGMLIISEEARAYLLHATKPRYDDWMASLEFEFWETERANMNDAIAKVNEFARKELGVDGPIASASRDYPGRPI